MKKLVALFCAVLAFAGGSVFTSNAALAQVWGIGPDGRMGYIQTRNPISPTCAPPQVWTMTNGHYSCQTPIPPAPTCQTGLIQASPPSWNGSSWVGLVCQMPQQPGPNTCQYGFATGPSWNGSAWVYSCAAPPPVVDLMAACQASVSSAVANGLVLGVQGYAGDVTNNLAMGNVRAQYPGDTLLSWYATMSNGCDSGGQIASGALTCAVSPSGQVDGLVASGPGSACHPH